MKLTQEKKFATLQLIIFVVVFHNTRQHIHVPLGNILDLGFCRTLFLKHVNICFTWMFAWGSISLMSSLALAVRMLVTIPWQLSQPNCLLAMLCYIKNTEARSQTGEMSITISSLDPDISATATIALIWVPRHDKTWSKLDKAFKGGNENTL